MKEANPKEVIISKTTSVEEAPRIIEEVVIFNTEGVALAKETS